MIFIAGISIALFISTLLIAKKKKSKADIILLLWMLLNAVHLGFIYLYISGKLYEYPQLLGLQFPLPLLHGVLLYYYVATVTKQAPKRRFTVVLHLLPALFTIIYLIPFMLKPAAEKIKIFKAQGMGYESFLAVVLIGIFLSGTIYVIWSSILLYRHNRRILNRFSDIEDIDLVWLRLLTYGLGGVWLLVIITQNDLLIFGGVSIFVFLIGFFGVRQKTIFFNDKGVAQAESSVNEEKEKYANSGLKEEVREKQYKELEKLMQEDKLFTNGDLSLGDLAGALNIHSNYLSQIINEKEGKNFYDYVNTFRVEEFKRLIQIPENRQYTLIALAYDCGFNSKSSFNRYFKKITGQTPSQYVKAISQ